MVKKIVVDIWKTGLHKAELGIKKKEEYRAKSKKFTKDMDIFGKVTVDKEDYGFVAYRENLWKNKNIYEKKLDVRLFTETMDWLGTIEENFAKSIVLSLVNEEPSHSFLVTLRGSRIVYQIESIRSKFMSGDLFYLPYIDENNQLRGLLLKSKRMTIGSDWEVKDLLNDKKIVEVDGKVIDIGGRWEIKGKKLKDNELINILVLFSATLKFYDELKERTEKVLEDLKKKKKWFKLDKSELTLFYNPRLRR